MKDIFIQFLINNSALTQFVDNLALYEGQQLQDFINDCEIDGYTKTFRYVVYQWHYVLETRKYWRDLADSWTKLYPIIN